MHHELLAMSKEEHGMLINVSGALNFYAMCQQFISLNKHLTPKGAHRKPFKKINLAWIWSFLSFVNNNNEIDVFPKWS